MNENIRKLMQTVAANEELQAKMKSFTDLDDAYEFAKFIQGGYTKDEFVAVMSKLSEKMSEKGELTDEDLANVAGGEMGTGTCVGITTASAVSIGVSAGAAAAV